MTTESVSSRILEDVNPEQQQAVAHGLGPLLIVAGAGTGKTKTLVHRVAHLIHDGVAPHRILLLTFSRRASAEMLRRVSSLLRSLSGSASPSGAAASRGIWGGTFHATSTRLLRTYAPDAGLDPDFTILDRSDSEDLMDVIRAELGLSRKDKRFPRKGTCMAVYSHCVNSRRPLEDVLADHFPWCKDWSDELKQLFRAYGEQKERSTILDYDDLLLFWHGLLADEVLGEKIRGRFDAVLVDEYQDTNRIQADILRLLSPDGQGLTAVGDDAQSIYSFRAATVRNILEFPQQFPGTTVIKLERNYRSTQPILDATNAVIAQAHNRYAKDLWTRRAEGDKPQLITCRDETEQADYLVQAILEQREDGVDLNHQAVLYRASHHSVLLEGELMRRNIPYVKYGGLKFLEAAHVKDMVAFLRLAENPRDLVSGTRVLQLLPGIGPKRARQLMDVLIESGGRLDAWSDVSVTPNAQKAWGNLMVVLRRLILEPRIELPAQVHLIRCFYEPILEEKYDNAGARRRDLEQMEQLATRFTDRGTMLTQMALDPPDTTEDLAGPPLRDEDYLILSTIHSAKGLEWDAVYVIHASDGNIPSDMATGSEEEIEEELRLFYVALTRARSQLTVCCPLRYYHASRGGFSDRHAYAQLSRFLTPDVKSLFACSAAAVAVEGQAKPDHRSSQISSAKIRSQIQSLWS